MPASFGEVAQGVRGVVREGDDAAEIDPTAVEVHVRPREREDFAGGEAGVRADEDEGSLFEGGVLQEALKFVVFEDLAAVDSIGVGLPKSLEGIDGDGAELEQGAVKGADVRQAVGDGGRGVAVLGDQVIVVRAGDALVGVEDAVLLLARPAKVEAGTFDVRAAGTVAGHAGEVLGDEIQYAFEVADDEVAS